MSFSRLVVSGRCFLFFLFVHRLVHRSVVLVCSSGGELDDGLIGRSVGRLGCPSVNWYARRYLVVPSYFRWLMRPSVDWSAPLSVG